MLLNLSLFYLNVMHFSSSPFIISSSNYQQNSNNFAHLHINNFSSTFFYTSRFKSNYYDNPLLFLKESLFNNILSNTIIISSLDEIKNDAVFNSQLQIPASCDSVILNNCCFANCMNTPTTFFDGSAIHISITWCELHVMSCIFVNCTTTGYGGAIFTGGHGFNISSSMFVQCTCDETGMAIFANLYKRPTTSFMFAYYQETLFTKCQGKCNVVDVNTSEIRVSTSNITYNSNREYNSASSPQQNCCGIPFILQQYYLEFIYVNIIGNDGDFLIHIDQKPDGFIHSVNIISNINLNYFFFYDIKPLQYMSHNTIEITNFAFFNNKPRSELDGIKIINQNNLTNFHLNDCVFDYTKDQLNSVLDGETESGGHYGLSLSLNGGGYTYTQISLLVKPSICAIQSDPFTPSQTFSESEQFSSSGKFSSSQLFTKSDVFTQSKMFSSSKDFSNSFDFSMSSIFPPSSKFSPSEQFSYSVKFSNSKKFSFSEFFTCSHHFSDSDYFAPSSPFEPSLTFSKSKKFTSSICFSISDKFTQSEKFTVSIIFSNSMAFSNPDNFSPSFVIMPFSPSFTASNSFTTVFSTGTFTSSNSFTILFSTRTFTSSNSFTPSMFFTPNRTKVPDPQNIFHRPQVGGKNDVFSKEELKKAAAPVSISFIIIIVSIILAVLYLKRKLKEIRHQDDVPDFDSSFTDETEVDSEYSYSYYTYTYCYSSVVSSSGYGSSQRSYETNENEIDDDFDFSDLATDCIIYDENI